MQEVVNVGRAKGLNLPENYAEDRLDFCDSLPASMTSSMHADLERVNHLELPWLNGAVVRLAKERQVSTPLDRAVSDILEPFFLGFRQKI